MEENGRIAIAVLEEKVRNTDAGLNRLEKKVDAGFAELKADMKEMRGNLDAKVDAVKDSIASAKIWALGLYIALAGAMFAALARGFGWI